MHYNDESYQRASKFGTATLVVVSFQFLYICLEIIVRKQKISEVGSILFISYALFDFFIIFGYNLVMMYHGAEANLSLLKVKQIFNKLNKDCIETKTLCDNGRVFAKKQKNT